MQLRQMRRLLMSFVALGFCSVSASTYAADLTVIRAPAIAPFSWAGIYAGVNVGGVWGDPQITSSAVSTVSGPAVTAGPTAVLLSTAAVPSTGTAKSTAGGFQVGYNLQSGWWVYGLETDLSVTKLQVSNPGLTTFAHFFGGNNTASLQSSTAPTASVDWFGTLRGRLGFAWNRVLVYGTGGLAYGLVSLNDGAFFNGSSGNGGASLTTFNSLGTPQTSTVKVGWVAGAGLDYAVSKNFIVTLTYLHIDLGDETVASAFLRPSSVSFPASTTVVRGATTTTTSFAFDEVRVAAGWKM